MKGVSERGGGRERDDGREAERNEQRREESVGKFCQMLNAITKLYVKGQNMVNDKSGAVKGLHLQLMMWGDRGGRDSVAR